MRRLAITLRWVVLFVWLCGFLGWTQEGNEAADGISIDVGWVTVVQQSQGWLITEATPELHTLRPPPTLPLVQKQSLILLRIDGHDVDQLGPLAVTEILRDALKRSVSAQVRRDGRIVSVLVFGEPYLADNTTKSEASYRPDDLQKTGCSSPGFLVGGFGRATAHRDSYHGKWILLTFWGTWCAACTSEIPALNYLSANYKSRLTVVSVAMNDSPQTLRRFLAQQPLSYPVLLGGTFDDQFARSYGVHSAPTDVVIAPNGEVCFVGAGVSLKKAVQAVARGQRKQ
jgi:thiol-disulfide isomerase/thioredoxin